ncbi:2-oxoglutarate dehydrogenase, E2 component, dihydrolipoamide succinyltransferase [Pseudokineococcus lusitanus]|uniref:Dihydrolipoamide acetyltransferase component of pyruvate dehydrogenase complex n=1 Tax=Pseudokineococcus lusitanus TaxID=763993 RepID=A0A3N1HT78_9ACTN|nr:2-oxoglutarate dehydrogenase, E2 component, dihydrolipoamide succinyltransferase [Pseudokineococcus lusitanus]ROP45733.1 2-oxoglutarate dehydrogenase E2 component [Pseudokineococcus lusitanus]
MSQSVQMPALGESVTEGTVTRWLKQVGESVEVDEPLLEVSTDKVDTEVPSPFAGTLQKILVEEDETVEVGADLAVIGDGEASGDDSSDGGQEQASTPEQPSEPEPAPAAQEPAPQASGDQGGDQGGEGTPVVMPALGESVTEGTVTRWLKSEGETVELDEPLLEVSTDKVDTEIPSPVAGLITKILVGEDETVAVGTDLAIVGGSADGGSGQGGQAEEAAAPAPGGTDDVQDLGDEAQAREAAKDEAEQKAEQGTDTPSEDRQTSSAPEPDDRQAPPAGQSEPEQAKEQDYSSAPQVATGTAQPEATPAPGAAGSTAQPPTGGAGYVTPLVRRLAQQHGVDLSTLTGTGVGGRLRKQDVLAAAEKAQQAPEPAAAPAAPAPAPAAAPASSGPSVVQKTRETAASVASKRGTTEKMSRLRKVIAQRMVESLQVSAQLTSVVEVDLTRVARLRARAKSSFEQREGGKLSFMPFFALAVTEALKAYPQVNASVEGDSVVYHAQENIGIAVDTERGLLVPVIKDAGDLNLAGLNKRIADLAERTRTNKVTPDDLAGGTFTITNTGSRGALFDTPIINQPQVAILGTGAIVKRPVVVSDGEGGETIAIRSMMYLALSYDHRIVDGADAARFLSTLKARLEEGDFASELGL